jgi:hypothetical protein
MNTIESIRTLREKAAQELKLGRRIEEVEKQIRGILGEMEEKLVELKDQPPLLLRVSRSLKQVSFQRPTGVSNMKEYLVARVKEEKSGDTFSLALESPGGVCVVAKLSDEPTVYLDLDSDSLSFFKAVLSRAENQLD